jgi:hypothetical protein
MSACGHPYHLNCFIIEVGARYSTDRYQTCVECQGLLIENPDQFQLALTQRINSFHLEEDHLEEEHEDDDVHSHGDANSVHSVHNDSNRYKTLYETSEPFRKDVKKIQTASKEVRKLKKEVAPILKQKEEEFKQKTKPILESIKTFVQMVKTIRKTTLKECNSLPLVQTLRKKHASLNRHYYATRTKYDIIGLRRFIPGLLYQRYYTPMRGINKRIRNSYRYI